MCRCLMEIEFFSPEYTLKFVLRTKYMVNVGDGSKAHRISEGQEEIRKSFMLQKICDKLDEKNTLKTVFSSYVLIFPPISSKNRADS